jgi:sarcosine oxidase, subunit alpha
LRRRAAAKAAPAGTGGSTSTRRAGDAKAGRRHVGLAPGAEPAKVVKAFVDFQNDVTAKDIGQAVREGMRSIEHVKRFTTNGMATDQGKTSNVHGLSIAAEIGSASRCRRSALTTFRPPYTPVTFGAIVGHSRGALFDVDAPDADAFLGRGAGRRVRGCRQWKRAWYFPKPGEDMHAAVAARMPDGARGRRHLRRLDARQDRGPGRTPPTFMEPLYTNAWRSSAPALPLWHHAARGRLRHGRRRVGRLAEDRFHVTTTTGGAARVLHHMEDYSRPSSRI